MIHNRADSSDRALDSKIANQRTNVFLMYQARRILDTMANSSLWQRFQRYFLEYRDLGFSLDISRMKFPDDLFEKLRPQIEHAFAAMRELEAGAIANPTDFRFIARRIVIFASEDVGLADPEALQLAIATQQAVEFVGMPEARIPLAHATAYMCRAAKSREAYDALNAAIEKIEMEQTQSVPEQLKNIHFPVNPES